MGASIDVVTDGRTWRESPDVPSGQWLRVVVHDSDVGAIEYSPRFGGAGVAYAGVTARTYFGDPSIPATNKQAEVEALVQWFAAAGVTGESLRQGLLDLLVDDDDEFEPGFVEEALADFFGTISLGSPFEGL